MRKTDFLKLAGLLLLIVSIPVSVFLVKQITRLTSRASESPANIVVDTTAASGFLPRPWRNIAQGGEELVNFLDGVGREVGSLNPKYIRIDHVYDAFEVVGREGNELKFDFSRLDLLIEKIRGVGATPFLALSYMPQAIATTDIVSTPKDWNEWSLVVRRTIEHYSGEKGIAGMYYEVWNEPDLFGKFTAISYIPLYRAASRGAAEAVGVLPFKIGGPATTGLYKNWVDTLMKTVQEEKLRLDFISWHRYDTNPERHIQDISEVESWVGNFPYFSEIELWVTEWGPYSDNNPMYDEISGAAHLLTVVRLQMGKINSAFLFSVKDGKDPNGSPFWGRWGLFTSDATGNKPKPRFTALSWLTDLGNGRLSVSGEGSWVKAIAARKDGEVQLVLINYDPGGSHSETVPVKVTGLDGNYKYKERYIGGETRSGTLTSSGGEVSHQVFLKANESVFLTIFP